MHCRGFGRGDHGRWTDGSGDGQASYRKGRYQSETRPRLYCKPTTGRACVAAEKAQPEKGDLKIYIYHGNSRKNDLEFLADFDVVITTFSVLQTEYSKQIKTSEGEKSYLEKSHINTAACSSAATPSTSDFGADDHEGNDLDGYGQSLTQGHEKPEVRAERLSLQRNSGDAKKKNKNMDMDLFGKKTASEVVSPLQAVEWFRVVLDEAQ